MAGQMAVVLRYVRHLVSTKEDEEQNDSQLLQQFVAQRDEGAFTALLQRHGSLVFGVCRQVLCDPHDAEDAFQATFLVLARKAVSIRRQESLAAWLHRVALNIARSAKTDAARRRTHERQAVPMSQATPAGGEALRDWQPILHEEVDRLPEKYRVPVVLCYFEGKTHDETARQLDWPVGTVKGRLARARDLLRARLARRGLALAGGVSALLGQGAAQAAVPATLAESTLLAALQFASGPAASAVASAATLRLAQEALKTMSVNRFVMMFVVAAAVVVAGGGLLALGPRAEAPPRDRGSRIEDRGSTAASQSAILNPQSSILDRRSRIVFVGDSSTDGNTYLLLIRQGLTEAGRPVPLCINAGVSVDTVRGVRQRLERDVLVHRPTQVVFSAGIADAIRDLAPADYESEVRAIASQLQTNGVPLLLLTTGVLGPDYADAEARLAEYNAILRRLAGEFGCPVADAHQLIREARVAGQAVVEKDNLNPTYEGQRLIARAVLDALNHSGVPVPKELVVRPLPGVLKEWRLRIAPNESLDERLVAALEPDGPGWTTYTLPEEGPAPTWWFEQERQRGFAVSLDKRLGKALAYQGVAYLQADQPKTAFLHTGGDLKGVWLNGECVHRNRGWTGWHAGKERLPVQLRAGRNVLVIETGSTFFLSVTDDIGTPDEG